MFETAAEREAATNFLIAFVGATCAVFTLANADERRVAIEALRMAEYTRASLELQAATDPLTTTTHYPQNYVFLDQHVIELPSGIDPSFLSALPDQLRREVIVEQFRVLGVDVRNRPVPVEATAATTVTAAAANATSATANTVASQPATSAAAAAAASAEINPEFLAALPPQIQQELLTQQRIEQQARMAAAAAASTNANQPTGSTNGKLSLWGL